VNVGWYRPGAWMPVSIVNILIQINVAGKKLEKTFLTGSFQLKAYQLKGQNVIGIARRYIMKLFLEHYLNPLHVLCRLVQIGVSMAKARRIATIYEFLMKPVLFLI